MSSLQPTPRGLAPRKGPGGMPAAGQVTKKRPSSNRGQSTPYFSDNKRSEVNELRTTLNTLEVQRDPKRYREAVQKVIHYMTLGVDVSRLFPEMIKATVSPDLVQKKLVFLYLIEYAGHNEEITLLAINTFQKNCSDGNPMVRGMALRSMCSLRVENLVEYVLQPLQDGLRDKSPYVRKTAVMGCVKLYYTSAQVIHDGNIPDTLYAMLRDRDEMVVANSVVALEEILATRGGIQLTQEIAHRLMQNLGSFPTWCQCQLMAILVRYVPADEDDVFDILNVLDDRLKHANSAVVLAAAKLFLHFTEDMDDEILEDVYARLKTPLITLMASGEPELRFTLLHHLELLLAKFPELLADDFQSFFCQYNEPSYVKKKKLEILTAITGESNFEAIVEELAAYITDVDVSMARRSITAMGKIAIQRDQAAEHILGMLILFFDLNRSYITADTLVVLQDILRKYPDLAPDVIGLLPELHASGLLDDEPEARCALVWMLGEFGLQIESAPYILEEVVKEIETEDSHAVRLQLLTSCLKLFFERAPEMQATLGRLLEFCVDEEEHQDVHDRALLYYRLLQSNLDEAKRIVGSPKEAVAEFAETEDLQGSEVFKEFNTLSVIYRQPSKLFVEQTAPYNAVGVAGSGAEYDPAAEPGGGVVLGGRSTGPVGDLLGGNMFSAENAPAGMQLNPDPKISPQSFEQKWTTLEISLLIKDILKTVPTAVQFEQLMGTAKIKTLAVQPPQNGLTKFYMFAQELGTENYHLLEVVVEMSSRCLTATFKSDDPNHAGDFGISFRGALAGAFEVM